MNKDDKIYVAGHTGLAGSAILRALKGYTNVLTMSSKELDLTQQHPVNQFFRHHQPDYVFLCAAKVGGIHANVTYPADFIYQNLMIQSNVIHAAHQHGVKRLIFLGSSCIYPRHAPQPMQESALLTGPLERTNQPYAIAKIAGIELCQSINRQHGKRFISLMPTNLYGPQDNYDLETSHVLPALMRKMHEAKTHGHDHVTLWGTGTPLREFLHSDDLASAALHVMHLDEKLEDILNVGSGEELTIRDLAELIADVIGYKGTIRWDSSKPDGTPRKLLDSSRLNHLGWKPKISLREGITNLIYKGEIIWSHV